LTKNPLVSILINNYNKGKVCEKSVKSAINQTYKKIEVIFYDDGSKDNSLKKVEKLKKKYKKRISIIKNKNRGEFYSVNQISAIEKSLKKSKGEIACILDSDDFFKKDKVKKVVNYFLNNQAQIVYDRPILFYNKKKLKKSEVNFFQRENKWPKFPSTSCISFKTKFLKKNIKKININKFEDLWFDFRISTFYSIKKKQFNLIDDHLTYYRQDSNNFDKKYQKFLNKKWWDRRKQAFDFLRFLDKEKFKKNIFTLDYLITTIMKKFFLF